jgi:uncharacterized protein YbjT (DUF2867 family)
MILVTGAGGRLGSAVVENLLRLTSASHLAVSVRKPNEAQSLAARGIDVRHADFDVPKTLDRAFQSIDRLLIISSSGIDHQGRLARHQNAVDAAVRARVAHVYYTSLVPGDDSIAYVMKAHLDTEAYLRASSLRYTILGDGVYAEAWATYLGDLSNGEVAIPADGPISWVSRADLAEGIARLLVEGGHAGEKLRLTGPAALDIAAVTEIASRILGRHVGLRVVGVEEYVAREVAAGKSESFARQWATTYAAMARGEFAAVDPLLEKLLGRPRRTMEELLPPLLRQV